MSICDQYRTRSAPTSCQSLEPRQLLAATFNGTDEDGDTFSVKLTGPGDLVIITSDPNDLGFIANLVFSNTTLASKLSISVTANGAGDGRLRVDEIQGVSDIGTISGKACDQNFFGFINVGVIKKIEFGDIAGSNTVTIGGGDADKVSLLFKDIGGGNGDTNFNVGARVSSLTASSMELDAVFARGADSIKATASDVTIDFDIPINPLFPTSVKSITAASIITLDGEVGGRIDSMKAFGISGSLDFGTIGKIETTGQEVDLDITGGAVDSIKSKTNVLGTFVVDRIGTLTAAGDIIDVNFNFGTPDAKGFVLNSLKAVNVTNSVILKQGAAAPGTLKKIDVQSWIGGQLEEGAIETLKCKGDFSAFVSFIAGQALAVSVKSATIGGTLTNQWVVPSRVSSLTAGRMGTSVLNQFRLNNDSTQLPLDVAKMKITGPDASFLEVLGRSMGAFESKGAARLFATFFGSFSGDQAIQSLKGGLGLEPLIVIEPGAGGIGSIKATSIVDGAIDCPFIGTIDVSASGGAGGTVSNTFFELESTRADGFSLKRFKTSGANEFTTIKAIGPIGTVDVLNFTLGAIKSGKLGGNIQLESDLTGFDPAGRIDSIKLRQAFSNNGAFAALRDANIMAPTIGSISVTGRIPGDNGGSIFGIGFRTLTGSLKVRDENNQAFAPTLAPAPADLTFVNFGGDDFHIRVYV